MIEKRTIIVIDDHPIIHEGLKTLLAPEPDLKVTMNARSSTEAIQKLAHTQPDLAIVDLSLGESDGTYLIQQLKSDHPNLLILVYTMSEEKLFAERTAAAGADGYVMKTQRPADLKKAIRALLQGKLYFEADTLRRIKKVRLGKKIEPQHLTDLLSPREIDVFNLLGQGLDGDRISEKLDIRRNTIDTHRINIKNKLKLRNGKALDRFAYEVIKQGQVPKK